MDQQSPKGSGPSQTAPNPPPPERKDPFIEHTFFGTHAATDRVNQELQPSLWSWVKRLISLKPHFAIGGLDNPYLFRWYVLPRNPWLNLYLHKFVRDDEDRALHDHPWWFVSLILRGGYVEHYWGRFLNGTWGEHFRVAKPGSIIRRPATHQHRVVLNRGSSSGENPGQPLPAWTLFLTGPKFREWGFWCRPATPCRIWRDWESDSADKITAYYAEYAKTNRFFADATVEITDPFCWEHSQFQSQCRSGRFVHWQTFTDPGDSGATGRGCE